MTPRMNARLLLVFAFLGCAPAEPSEPSEEVDSAESDLTTYGRGLVATGDGQWLNETNVARELEAAGAANVPGVLSSSHSTSPYMFASQVELVAWSDVWMDAGHLVVRIEGAPASRQGKAAKALYDALNVAPVAESGAQVKRTPRGSVACYAYSSHVQCQLGALTHARAK
jgi:hypothetical protein